MDPNFKLPDGSPLTVWGWGDSHEAAYDHAMGNLKQMRESFADLAVPGGP